MISNDGLDHTSGRTSKHVLKPDTRVRFCSYGLIEQRIKKQCALRGIFRHIHIEFITLTIDLCSSPVNARLTD
jgi:hypothetical protein